MRQNILDILIATITKDDTGREIKKWSVNCTSFGGFQTVNYVAGYKPFGVTDKTSNVFYCKDIELMKRYYLLKTDSNQFNVTYRIGVNNRQYIINSILPFPNHMEIYLELVV